MIFFGWFLALFGIITAGSMAVGVSSGLACFKLSGSVMVDVVVGIVIMAAGIAIIITNRNSRKAEEESEEEKLKHIGYC